MAEVDDPEVTEVGSLCMNCEEQGVTKLLLSSIPYFGDVLISSFQCDHCHHSNTETKPISTIKEFGITCKLLVEKTDDLSRQIVRSDYCGISIPEIEFQIPPRPDSAVVTTIEGILNRTYDDLKEHLPKMEETEKGKMAIFLQEIQNLLAVSRSFHIILDDFSGNSYIENIHMPKQDPNLEIKSYRRSSEQDVSLGLIEPVSVDDQAEKETDLKNEVLMFPTTCSNCKASCNTNMKIVQVPNFKEVIIMCMVCDKCGFRDSEVKSGAGIEKLGIRFDLHITDPSDLTRDILKSDTCEVSIPHLDFELLSGTLGGKFTTTEGLLVNIREQLEKNTQFITGDSGQGSDRNKLEEFCQQLEKISKGEKLDIHFILTDPAGNSYIEDREDGRLRQEKYERSQEENDLLGITELIKSS